MKIAHVNLAKGIRGGENQTLALIDGLKSHPIDQVLFCRKGSDLERIANEKQIITVPVGKPFFFHAGKLREYDLVHVHEGRSTYLALVARLLFKIPYLMTRRIPNRPHDKWITRLAYGSASCIVSLSRKIDEVMRAFVTVPCYEIIPSVARELRADATEVARLKERFRGKFVIGHIGALNDHHKNQSLIIEAAKILQEHKELVFVLLGSGKDEMKFKAQAAGLSSVVFEGYKNNTADYYALFDLFVYPSNEEGLGSAILEAYGFKLPVIASDVDGIPDIVEDGTTGLLISPDDAHGFAASILGLVRDDQRRETLARGGFHFRENFSQEKITQRYLTLYSRIGEQKQ